MNAVPVDGLATDRCADTIAMGAGPCCATGDSSAVGLEGTLIRRPGDTAAGNAVISVRLPKGRQFLDQSVGGTANDALGANAAEGTGHRVAAQLQSLRARGRAHAGDGGEDAAAAPVQAQWRDLPPGRPRRL